MDCGIAFQNYFGEQSAKGFPLQVILLRERFYSVYLVGNDAYEEVLFPCDCFYPYGAPPFLWPAGNG
jgi:hypothetical protein